jgi:hypothetical protein
MMSLSPIALALVLAPQQPPANSLEIVPLLARRPLAVNMLPPFGTLLPRPTELAQLRRDLLRVAGDDGDVSVDELPQRLLESVHQPDSEAGRLNWSLDSQQLFLTGQHDLVARTRDELIALGAVVQRPIEVTAELYAGTDIADPPVLIAGGDARDAGRGELLWSAVASAPQGRALAFDAMRWSRYVYGANVEVAQKSMLSNAVLGVFGEGLSATVLPCGLAGSEDVVLYVQFACGQRRRIDSVSTGVPGQASIDVPLLETTFATAAARVPAGGTLQIVVGGHADAGARLVLALRPRYPTPRPTPPQANFLAIPILALTTRAMRERYVPTEPTPQVGDGWPDLQSTFDGDTLINEDRLADVVRQAIGDEQIEVSTQSNHLLVIGPEPAQRTALATIGQLQDRLLQTTVVRVSTELEEVNGTAPFAVPVANAHRAVLHRIALPTLAGRTAFAFRGVESNAIRTMMPEIAQEAALTTPLVEVRQSGLWLRCDIPDAGGNDLPELFVQSDQTAPAQLRNLGGAGALHLADVDSLRISRRSEWPADRELVLGTGTTVQLDGRSWRPTVRAVRSRPGLKD